MAAPTSKERFRRLPSLTNRSSKNTIITAVTRSPRCVFANKIERVISSAIDKIIKKTKIVIVPGTLHKTVAITPAHDKIANIKARK